MNQMLSKLIFYSIIVHLTFFVASCAQEKEKQARWEHQLKVTARAYNSIKNQTNTNPYLTAWGDTLKPGMKAIAVSTDLIKIGLTHGTKVMIQGMDGEYTVRDKMHKNWRNKIDIYMGNDITAARKWGKRDVIIRW
jgi:3D (Asp-Asp-Asp) domain-containing protein